MRKILSNLILFTIFLGSVSFGQSQKWANEQSDLPKDSEVNYGQLNNGFKYAWSQKPEKKDHCFLRLMVHVGSLHEREDERGIAHFLEHLAFDGCKNFPKGSLINWFQEMGMKFGPHLNAHTGFDETVYKIDMPRCNPERVRNALTVFRDFADGLLLEESEIKKEQGIIDMEEQDRDSKNLRISRKMMEDFYQGTNYAERLPIGEKDIRKNFNRKKIEAFYKKWYRPDNMTLVLVGDFDRKGPENNIRDVFASMKKGAEEFSSKPDLGTLNDDHKEVVISEKDYPSVEISFLSTQQQEKPLFTKEDFLKIKKTQLLSRIYNYKVSQYLLEHKRDFYAVSLVDGFDLDIMRLGICFELHKDEWKSGLTQATILHNEIISCGFSEDDLNIVLSTIKKDLEDILEKEQPENVLSEKGISTLRCKKLCFAVQRIPNDSNTRRLKQLTQ
ncbi:MAG: insulinase family protein [Oligoflexales bacterium]